MIKVLGYVCAAYLHYKLLSLEHHHLPAGLHLGSALFSSFICFHCLNVSAGGGPRQGVYCQECVVALKLIYRTDCVALPQGIILFFWGGRAYWIISR